jgi:hypothetical protein
VKLAKFRADFAGDLIAVQNGEKLVEGKVVTCKSVFAEFGQYLEDQFGRKWLGSRLDGVQDRVDESGNDPKAGMIS